MSRARTMEMSWTNGRMIMMMRMTQIGDDDDPDARVTMTRTGGDDDDDDDSRTWMPPTPQMHAAPYASSDDDGDGERCGDDNDQEDGDDDHGPNASGPWTPSPMTQYAAYNSEADKVGLEPNQVKAVVEAMIALAGKQLKSCGSFKMAGAFNLQLKRSQSKKPASFGANLKMTVRARLTKKMKTMLTTPIADAD